jgi:two-component system sensor histidine kinase KdpD
LALISFLCRQPLALSFTVADIRHVITFIIFLGLALFASHLSTRLRLQVVNSRRREARVSALYSLSRDIAAVADLDPIIESIVKKVADTIQGEVVLLLPDKDGKPLLRASSEVSGNGFFNENELKLILRTIYLWLRLILSS